MVLSALVLPFLVTQSDLDDKVKSVLPTAQEERWLQIPWRMNVMAARVEAQKLGKPMFLWIMNGHPMGCT